MLWYIKIFLNFTIDESDMCAQVKEIHDTVSCLKFHFSLFLFQESVNNFLLAAPAFFYPLLQNILYPEYNYLKV